MASNDQSNEIFTAVISLIWVLVTRRTLLFMSLCFWPLSNGSLGVCVGLVLFPVLALQMLELYITNLTNCFLFEGSL